MRLLGQCGLQCCRVWYFTGSEGGVTEAYWYAGQCSHNLPQLLSQIIPRTMKSGGLTPKRVSEKHDWSISQLTNTPWQQTAPVSSGAKQ